MLYTKRVYFLGNTLIILILILSFTDFTSAADKHSKVVTRKSIKSMIEKATPLIENVTGRKYNTKLKYRIVNRDIIVDLLTQEISTQRKKFPLGMDDDVINRQAEMAAQTASQSILGKYSAMDKQFYIIPENIKTMAKMLEIKDEELEKIVFLLVTHEMVHALDDQYFDFQKKINSIENEESYQAFIALVEGHAVFVTKKIANCLNIPETTRQVSSNSTIGIYNEDVCMQNEFMNSIYVKGAEFVEVIIDKKGPAFIANMFHSPPGSTRQILRPEEYLNQNTVAGIDCSKLIGTVSIELPTAGMRSRILPVGSMALRALLISKGVTEHEASNLAYNILDGASYIANSIEASNISILILSFNNAKTVTKYFEVKQKIEKSEIAQLTNELDISIDMMSEEDLKIDGFDFGRYNNYELIKSGSMVSRINTIGAIGNLYLEIEYRNMELVTKDDVLEILHIFKTELHKIMQRNEERDINKDHL